MKFNPFDGVQAADWALTAGAEASARHANARRACFRCDLLGGVYISGQARRSPFLNTAAFSITNDTFDPTRSAFRCNAFLGMVNSSMSVVNLS